MRSLLLRRFVTGIGLFVALTTAFSFPLGFAAVSYLHQADTLSFRARLDAARVAKYVFVHGPLWPFHRVRLVELVEPTDEEDNRIRQRIYTADGKKILEEGPEIVTPVMARSAPIEVNGTVVGHVEVEASLWPLLVNAAYVAMYSYALGCLAYFAIRVFPVRALDRALGELEEANRATKAANAQLQENNNELMRRDEELGAQNLLFETALENMSQGLCMFDKDMRLIISNRKYFELYGLPPEMNKPSITLMEILEARIALGSAPRTDAQAYVRERLAVAAAGKPCYSIIEMEDGRVLAVTHQPMRRGGWVATHVDITERRLAEERIAHMARYDGLTDLPNRVLFREKIEQALSQQRGLAILCIDMDHFREVNDALGHGVGDALIRAVAERIQGCVGEADTVARLSGDEFAVLQVAADQPAETTDLGARLIEALAAPFDLDGHHVVIGASIGIALAPEDGRDSDQLLKAANMALGRAKQDGRGRYCFFESEMDARMQRRRGLELDLREALANEEFELHYQPLVNARTEEVTGFEALVRWREPERGLVSPAEFIPLAEEIGLIVPLGEWVLRQACAEAATWPSHLKVAVNLSPAQFEAGSLALTVVSALAASGLAPERLELEITETVMLCETEATLEMLHQLRGLGVRISMDDFGTGYSSLSYLRKFPFDKIKIDQSFIRDLSKHDDSIAIVRAVTSLGTSLGMATTAEGVETREQLEMLRAENCTEVQGYLFSRPRPAAELPALWARRDSGTEAAA